MSQSTADTDSRSPRSDERIRVRREWVGAPTGTLANPTCWLFAVTVAVFGGTTSAYLAGALPAAAAIALNAVAIYFAFTVMHESMHGIAHENRTANRWLGYPMGVLLTIPLPMFRAVHHEHHSHTNDPERDPDLFMSAAPVWLLPVWALGVVFEYRRHYYGRKLWRNRTELGYAVASEALLAIPFLAALATGNFTTLAVVWFVPSLLAVMFLAITFDYLPHYPYDSCERYHDTRVYPGRAAFIVLLGQNYHLIHHLWTTVPWYRYRNVFDAIRPELEARGARIGWRVASREAAAGSLRAGAARPV